MNNVAQSLATIQYVFRKYLIGVMPQFPQCKLAALHLCSHKTLCAPLLQHLSYCTAITIDLSFFLSLDYGQLEGRNHTFCFFNP